jgi:hypothetical protein
VGEWKRRLLSATTISCRPRWRSGRAKAGRPCDEWPIRDRSNANTRAFINVPLAVDGTPLGMLHFDAVSPARL